jgi:predicted alpha-1,6-mannanase (GH76 family)
VVGFGLVSGNLSRRTLALSIDESSNERSSNIYRIDRIAVYDVTGDHKYLYTAQVIFDNMNRAYNTTPCGGLWWDKPHTYVNAIANELYIDAAAHLAARSGDASQDYLNKALTAWDWFQKSGLINDEWLINDGLDNATCGNNGGTVW